LAFAEGLFYFEKKDFLKICRINKYTRIAKVFGQLGLKGEQTIVRHIRITVDIVLFSWDRHNNASIVSYVK